MFYVCTVRDSVRVPPRALGREMKKENLKEAVLKQLKEDYEGYVDEDLGVIVAVLDVKELGEVKLPPGDPNAYIDAVFDILTFYPLMQEVVDGIITDITEFGAFARIGPMDGLIHVSQIMDDYVRYDPSIPAFIGKETNRTLKMGDLVRARIVSVSLKETVTDSKVGLTMRQPGLGKWEWIEAEKKKAEEEKKKKEGKK